MATRAEKKALVDELVQDLEQSGAVYIANYEGISVADVNDLRGQFKEGEVKYKVYKNTLAKMAMEKVGGYEDLYPLLHNQNAFIFIGEDLGKPAKILKEYLKEHKQPQFKGALVEGAYYPEDSLDALASMKSKTEIIGDIIGLLQSPLSNVISGLQAQGSNLVGAVKTISEKEN